MTYVSPSTGRAVEAVMFDTFGSVVDWRSGVTRAAREFFDLRGVDRDPAAFADAWRARYEPSMEPVRRGDRAFVPLDVLHLENLRATLDEVGLAALSRLPDDELATVNAAWERLDPWPDSIAGIRMLAEHCFVGPLSNANTALLLRMARHAGLPWNVVLGADTVHAYKPSPQAYRRMARLLRLDPGEVMLAAAHNTDLAAARAAGLATGFVARPTELGPGQTRDLGPEQDWDVVADSIVDLAARLTSGCDHDAVASFAPRVEPT